MRFVFIQLFIFFVLLGCSTPRPSDFAHLPDPLNLNVTQIELDNGFKAIVVEDNRLPIYSLQMFYKVGGKDEEKGITGASHFLEHLMFKGTKNITANKFDYIVEGNGGNTNAYTTNDLTAYYVNMPSQTLDLMIGIEADRIVNLVIDKKEFEQERYVVLEERKMRYENSPRGQLYLKVMEKLFESTPYGTSVIGDIEDLKNVTREQIFEYYKQWYAPNNVVMVIVGDVKASQVKSLVKKHFSKLKASFTPTKKRLKTPDSLFESKLKKSKNINLYGQSKVPMFMLSFPAARAGSAGSYVQDMLSSILGDGKSSYLYQKFVLASRPQVSSIYTGNYSLEKSGAFMIGGELLPGVSPKQFKNDLLQSLKKSCKEAVNDRTLQKVKNQYEIQLFSSLDTVNGLGQFLGTRQLMFGDWAYYKQEFKIYNEMKVEDLVNTCQDLFNRKNHVWVTVWEKNKGK